MVFISQNVVKFFKRKANFCFVLIILHTDQSEKLMINLIAGCIHFAITKRITKEGIARSFVYKGRHIDHLFMITGVV